VSESNQVERAVVHQRGEDLVASVRAPPGDDRVRLPPARLAEALRGELALVEELRVVKVAFVEPTAQHGGAPLGVVDRRLRREEVDGGRRVGHRAWREPRGERVSFSRVRHGAGKACGS